VTKTLFTVPPGLRKIRGWVKYYLPAEITGSVFAVLTAIIAFHLTDKHAVSAIAATAGENIGFYGAMAVTEWRIQCFTGRSGVVARIKRTFGVLLIQFGPAEALDSALLRPLSMYVGPMVTGGIGTGALLGKIMADGIFYGLAIISYEMHRHWSHSRSGEDNVYGFPDALNRKNVGSRL
jgi:hypothetical protein